MPSEIYIVRPGHRSLETILRHSLRETRATSLGLAVAYVSVYGAEFLKRLLHATAVKETRLVADIRDGISHPEALRTALNERWQVRVVRRPHGTFHPKMYVAGEKFAVDGALVDPRMYSIGSNNLTNGGLNNNIECSVIVTSNDTIPDAGVAFGELWSCGKDLDRDGLERYEEYFAERNRVRSPTDLQVLGIADQLGESIEEIDVVPRSARHRAPPTISTRVASTAWAGLESSTGEYRFQVEFPRSAGEVLARLVGSFGRRAEVSVLCEDGVIRPMTYRFYEDNSMFRLNVPNDVAGVQEARTRRSGVALVEKVASQDAPVRLVIFHDRSEIDKIVKRSLALGTLGQTSTRLYGWY